jgi:glycerol-3-phosphate dehydrogenase (NAD(P)+)
MTMKITVIGAGAWGTALAISASHHGHAVQLWARDAAQARTMQADRENARYLRGVPLPPMLCVRAVASPELAAALHQDMPDVVVVGTPMAGLRE